MQTRDEHACTLLLSSSLTCFLWKETMKHAAWLQDCTPAHALEGKTPHEMGNKKEPHPAGIQEFGAVAYVKDLAAGKLDAQGKKGQSVGYDSESKEYRIYWPDKRAIMVKQNIVFNHNNVNILDNTAIIHGKVQSEGEKEKVIQSSQNNAGDIEKPENQEPEDQQSQEKATDTHQSPKTTNTIQFTSTDKSQVQPDTEHDTEQHDDKQSSTQQYGCGQRNQHLKGTYKAMNKSLIAAIMALVEEPPEDDNKAPADVEAMQENVEVELIVEDKEGFDSLYELPPDTALVGCSNRDPKTFDEALHGPDAKHWQEALEY